MLPMICYYCNIDYEATR